MSPKPRLNLVADAALELPSSAVGVLVSVDDDGTLRVCLPGERRCRACNWLETGAPIALALETGDALLVQLGLGGRPIVLGRVGRYRPPDREATILEAPRQFTIRCGESSLTLKSNGQVLLKGEDVTVRAKGTQRIRAGNVAIN